MKKRVKTLAVVVLAVCAILTVCKMTNTVSVNAEDTASIVEMNRLYNPYSGEHFYTANNSERDYLVTLGWHYEGVGWYAPSKSNNPVYRLYNPNSGDHHYTLSASERDWLVTLGWNYEGIGWYSDDNKTVPVYRQYNPYAQTGTHNYTTSKSENDWLTTLGWRAEGIGWYGVDKNAKPVETPDIVVEPVVVPPTEATSSPTEAPTAEPTKQTVCMTLEQVGQAYYNWADENDNFSNYTVGDADNDGCFVLYTNDGAFSAGED